MSTGLKATLAGMVFSVVATGCQTEPVPEAVAIEPVPRAYAIDKDGNEMELDDGAPIPLPPDNPLLDELYPVPPK